MTMATKKAPGKSKRPATKSSKGRKRKVAGDPITIGGGGGLEGGGKGKRTPEFTYISFDAGIFVEDPRHKPKNPNKRRFSNHGSTISTFDLDMGGSHIPLKGEEPDIHCQHGPERIEVWDNPMSVEFDIREYQGSNGYYQKNTSIDSVDLKGGSFKRNKGVLWTFTLRD
jgi:hypothetical protein